MEHPNFFSGQNVTLFDATFFSFSVTDSISKRFDSKFYNSGIMNGLTVWESGTRAGTAAVSLGVAVDANGEVIDVPNLQDQLTYGGSYSGLLNDTSTYQLYASYLLGNDTTLGLDLSGSSQYRHYLDQFQIKVLKIGADTPGTDDILLAQITSTSPGASLIIDETARSTFSAKYQAIGDFGINGASIYHEFIGNGGLSVTGTACFFNHDVSVVSAGYGLLLTSPDGTKTARFYLGNSGQLQLDPQNYSLV